MKVKGLRWVVLSLIVVVTIINYLDRGTLNYMWVANTKVEVPAGEWSHVDSTNLDFSLQIDNLAVLEADLRLDTRNRL